MKKKVYRSTATSRKEAAQILAAMDGKRPWPEGTETHWVLPPREIKRIRHDILKLSQSGFARLLKKQVITIQSWEQGLRTPDSTTTVVIYLLGRKKQLRDWFERLDARELVRAA